ncbi:hypothetical protein ACFQRL_15475 [Microbacterium fluvii]|uniref:DUF4232 domain-containing protein n=1 Tax=Microbacterium fluvii TaxID=415215 RepID=A0ABW2HGD7_9MICO|nr:hypothetical protein [Microbacterium fluvii]MCU4673993.1 hypothetical protein [Microbacterium fluvii]
MTGTTPRRRHSPAVYRRRRLVVLLALLLVVAGVVWLVIAQPWKGVAAGSDDAAAPADSVAAQATTDELPVPGSTKAAAASPSASPSATPAASASGAATDAAPCVATDLDVVATTDKESYASGQNPQLSIELTNNGPACTMNVGTSTQVFTISSGDDVWWRSTDCQDQPSDMIVLLEEGQTVSSASPIEWDRTRSSVDSCDSGNRPTASGGGATYNLSVEIGGIVSQEATTFFLY